MQYKIHTRSTSSDLIGWMYASTQMSRETVKGTKAPLHRIATSYMDTSVTPAKQASGTHAIFDCNTQLLWTS